MTMNNKQITDRLDSIAESCNEKNWDSYNADPISPETISLAKKIAQTLSKDIDIELIVPTVNGEIALSDIEETWGVNVFYIGDD